MTTTSTPSSPPQTIGADLIDTLVGLDPASALYATRHARHKVVNATQASQVLFFSSHTDSLPRHERLLIALYASLLSRSHAMATYYRQELADSDAATVVSDAVEADTVDWLPASRIKAMLVFTRTLITRPIDGDKAALTTLREAGVSTPDIVTLAQLVAYLSYQIRVVAGLSAMKALESA
ncbi:CMD domain-containing protein [Pusillimonas sp. ANT_WB101]|uniref:CMD domain-containing protein n=1 Tax=Pusillimonas sp. ANT_WB101 TaxID=2597356 RepID=UPI0011ED638A|nr:CMD domain protein [Pusillimonas sp. ANT_WB101]KAA0890721.1 CMD domain protein [Pusillimonas sp. ANT_WB101]